MRKFIAIVSILALLLLASCHAKTIVITQPPDTIHTHDTVRLVTRAADTVCRIDSVWIMQTPDTTLIRVSRSTERIRIRTDTVRILRLDTVIRSIPLDKNTVKAIDVNTGSENKGFFRNAAPLAAILLKLIAVALIIILAIRIIRKIAGTAGK